MSEAVGLAPWNLDPSPLDGWESRRALNVVRRLWDAGELLSLARQSDADAIVYLVEALRRLDPLNAPAPNPSWLDVTVACVTRALFQLVAGLLESTGPG